MSKHYLLTKQPIAILSNGRLLVNKGKKRSDIEGFADLHKNEKIIAVSGTQYKCAFLTEEGRIYVVGGSSYGGKVRSGEPFGVGFKLFESFDKMMTEKEEAVAKAAAERAAAEQRRKEEEAQKASYREKGVCQYCGGTFKKGLFGIKCISCGRKKDY